MDAITLLKDQHREVEALFSKFEGLTPRAKKTKRAVVNEMIEKLSKHSVIEEMIFYPAAREVLEQKGESTVLEALEEHHILKWTLSELEDMEPDDERFDAKVTVMMENTRHHVKEEEQELFPMLRKQIDRARLREIGEQMAKAFEVAPSRPHPRAPDTPPGNVAAGAVAALTDPVVRLAKDVKRGVTRR